MKMKYIAHRIHTIEELQTLSPEWGVEIDLRDRGERLILQHDPFADGLDFEEYLPHFRHSTLILNVKAERVEYRVLELLKKFKVSDYFFLDSSFPMIVKLIGEGEKNIALRFSEFESLETVLAMRGKARWVWVDCFTKLPLDRKSYDLLKEAGFKLCLASPDLLGRPEEIPATRDYLAREKIELDAICTKHHQIPLWER